tara:strand:- start:3 stop:245 length:243 start_codon:yes stop_codon:yes gene_type:complete
MTRRQKQLFDFIRGYWSEHGFGPTYSEMQDGIGAISKGAIHPLVQRLVEQGHIRVVQNPGRLIAEPRGIIPVFPIAPLST